MRELNIEYLELYKKVDRFIRDAYSSSEGVSLYISQMEIDRREGISFVDNWDRDYRMLKRLRWIRNKLSHDAEIDSDICGQSDFDWLKIFSDRLRASTDPEKMLSKAREEQKKRQELLRMYNKEHLRYLYLEEEKQIQSAEQRKLDAESEKQSVSFVDDSDELDVEIERV